MAHIVNYEFLQLKDIPANGIVRKNVYGVYSLFVIDQLYRAKLASLYKQKINLEYDVKWESIDEALTNFSVYNITDDVVKIVTERVNKHIRSLATIATPETEDYITVMTGKHMKYRGSQPDNDYIINGFISELVLFATQMGLQLEGVEFTYGLRNKDKPRNVWIDNEVKSLKSIRRRLLTIDNILEKIILHIQSDVISRMANKDTVNLEFEL